MRMGSEIVLRHDLPASRTTEKTDMGEAYEFAWKGDEIVGINPHKGPLSFYPPLASPDAC